MIYVDVTGGCLLPLQSGIPRTTRGVWRLLQSENATPICWQPFRGAYTQLPERARQLLAEGPRTETGAAPRDATLPLLWASLRDLGSWPETVNLGKVLHSGDTLLLTSIFPDNRLGCLRRLENGPGRTVAIFHDAIPLRDANVGGWERRWHREMLRILSGMDLVVAVSRASAEELQALWREHEVSPTEVVVVPWPVPFNEERPEFSPPNLAIKRLLYVSRLKGVKNHATLFSACETLWREGLRFEVELIGCEDEAEESRMVQRQIGELRRGGRAISWRAQVSEAELHAAYRRASFTVFPSRAEGFGLPVLESFWHGRGVVCSDQGAVGELARDGGCVTVEVASSDSLAVAMRKLLCSDGKISALAAEAFSRALRTWPDYGRELGPLLSPP